MGIAIKAVPKGRGVRVSKSDRKTLIDVPFEPVNIGRSSTSIAPEDVIDLGAPATAGSRLKVKSGAASNRTSPPPRSSTGTLYTPNPRLYPGPTANKKGAKIRSSGGRRKRQKRERKFTKAVPNSRLYRPAPPRPPPPQPLPPGIWSTTAPTRNLETASKAAFKLLQERQTRPPSLFGDLRQPSLSPLRGSPTPHTPKPGVDAVNKRLVVTLPAASGYACYKPRSERLQLRARPSLGSGSSTPPAARIRLKTEARSGKMAATNKNSTSPDCSDGNDASSAPSEFLAEFLSAIMRRQYAEALKYCQLILQYEPHNATARGFYPLLQHKVNAHANTHRKAQKKEETSSESEDTSPRARRALSDAQGPQKPAEVDPETEGSADGSGSGEEEMEQGADGSGSACSSLELDSEPSPASPSPRTPRTPHTPRRSERDTTDPTDTTTTDPSDSASWRWESGGERSDRDDNGNRPAPHTHSHHQGGVDDKDVENDNALLPPHSHLTSESMSSLQRLRAQFTCSIK
ncbi:serine/arginine repetitive matrix protein 1 [Bicyclus anynana]|uniref:Serine/arginine repetitive matrix protein 1 n=1 Tax=Bicyclus anynana TaxID=110368 RepID=A0ABM3LLM3_BICAN|nr:serine/arginine repetitive matrix protein 1 [Bicyclus anynana]